MNTQWKLRIGALLAGLSVAAGAAGAHGPLYEHLAGRGSLDTFETAVSYQIYHGLALLLCAALDGAGHRTRWAALCFLVGTVLFSGSLYVIALGGPRGMGAVAPFGGVTLLVGWLLLLFCRRSG